MRITQKYLLEWLRQEFKRLEIDLEVQEIYKTRYSPDQYEAGACYFLFKVGKNGKFLQNVYIFYPIWFLQKCLNNGYELHFKPHEGKYISESQIDVRKK